MICSFVYFKQFDISIVNVTYLFNSCWVCIWKGCYRYYWFSRVFDLMLIQIFWSWESKDEFVYILLLSYPWLNESLFRWISHKSKYIVIDTLLIKKNQTLKTMSSYNLLWRDKKHFLRTWVKIHVIWRHLVTSWSNLKNHDRTFNNNQPINYVSILGRHLLFRVITFIPWYVLNYAKYKFLDKHLNISYPFI